MFKHDFSSEAFYQCYKEQQPEYQGAACSTEEFPAELEQSFQNIFDDPQFIQWMKLKFDKHSLGMEADGVLGLERSANVTPCFIEKGNGLSESCSLGLIFNVINGCAT